MRFTPNKQYSLWAPAVKSVRDAIEGETKIKSEGLLYLRHPDMIDQTSEQAKNRYAAYILGAEFDEYTSRTERSMLGRMTSGEHEIELPDSLSYLIQNSDGDGLPLSSMVELLYKNQLEVKFHILLAEMQSLDGLDIENISVADLKALNPQATIKSYTRESLIDWDFSRVNGAMQLTKLVLREYHNEQSEMLNDSVTTTYLVLGLDDNGYYQQKYVGDAKGEFTEEGERHYPTVGGSPLKWIPVQIVCDEAFSPGHMPSGLGFLGPIAGCALSKYNASGSYREALYYVGQPTIKGTGWKQGDREMFMELNGGRDYITTGIMSGNILPDGCDIELMAADAKLEEFDKCFKRIDEKAKSLGAVFPSDTQNQSATGASIEDANATAAMVSIVSNTEAAVRRCVSYCAMFMGLWSQDDVEDNLEQIQINLFSDFGKKKIDPQEQQAIRENVMAGMYSKDEGLRLLVAGGATVSDAETIIGELETQGPELPVTRTANPSQDQSLQSDQ